MKSLSVILLTFLILTPSLIQAQIAETQVVQISAETCGKQISSPWVNTRYEVYVFCEGALGRYIGVMRKAHLGAPIDDGWTLTTRFWQEDTWSTDVLSIAWVDGGKSLLVSNSYIYGEGELFLLDLEARSSRTVFSNPTEVGRDFTIGHVDESERKVFLNVEEDGKIQLQTVDY